jgi:hypothetical protein
MRLDGQDIRLQRLEDRRNTLEQLVNGVWLSEATPSCVDADVD